MEKFHRGWKMEGYDDKKQEIDIGKSPYGFYLDMNGQRLETKEFLKDILERLEIELKKAFNIPETKKKRFWSKK